MLLCTTYQDPYPEPNRNAYTNPNRNDHPDLDPIALTDIGANRHPSRHRNANADPGPILHLDPQP